ncbi:LLM class flavin-dependent oxidoreductase [Streptomyces sp. NPDC001928]|uniref:LLM class flavin-dependent oxidoreductase n=1 Tax=Streptomyces sp. NPDC001928 TaxID=3154404 RepID=UPI003332A5D1
MNTEIRGPRRGRAPVPLSVLDPVVVGSGSTAARALRGCVTLARTAERRGYHRFWVTEHHSVPGVATSCPTLILAHLAAHTWRIRLGSGGVMLPNHVPLVVAEQFGTLEALAPGRIDLGVGRAPGADLATATALRRTDPLLERPEDYSRQVGELIRFLDDDFPEGHPLADVHAVPGPVQSRVPGGAPMSGRPPVWLLGSGGTGAQLAAALGLPFAFAHHIAPAATVPVLDLYRQAFRPSAVLDRPYAMVSVLAFAAGEATEARRHALTGAHTMLRIRSSRPPGLVPDPDECERCELAPKQREFVDGCLAGTVCGTPQDVRAGLDELVDRTGAQELMIVSPAHSLAARNRSYELIADAYGLADSAVEQRPGDRDRAEDDVLVQMESARELGKLPL